MIYKHKGHKAHMRVYLHCYIARCIHAWLTKTNITGCSVTCGLYSNTVRNNIVISQILQM